MTEPRTLTEHALDLDLGAILDALPQGVLGLNEELVVAFANRGAAARLRQQPAQLLGASMAKLVPVSGDLDRLRAAATAGASIRASVACGDGVAREFLLTSAAPPTVGRPGLAAVLVLEDAAAEDEANADRHREERLQALGRMVGGFAHEVRNPLAGLQALGEALQAELPVADSRRQYAARLLALLVRIEVFIKTALQFAEPAAPRRARLQPETIVRRAVRALEQGSAARVRVELPATLPELWVDEAQAVDALRALLDNALESGGGPPVEVEGRMVTDGHGRWVCLAVRDQGSGMPADVLARACDPFFTTKPKAMGLGLAIAHTLAGLNGGHLRLSSRPGAGTQASLTWPAVAP